MRAFETLVTVAADDVTKLRRCDVHRLVETSQDVNGVDTQRFGDWLIEQRPDLAGEVCECLREVGQ